MKWPSIDYALVWLGRMATSKQKQIMGPIFAFVQMGKKLPAKFWALVMTIKGLLLK
jgi:hypothetical protein